MSKIRVAIVGVGNCANSLVQGLHYYQGNMERGVGLAHPLIANYKPADIEVVAAFDVNDHKVGTDLSNAIWQTPNDTYKFADVPHQNVTVQRGPTIDGLGHYLIGVVKESPLPICDVAAELRDAKVDVVINYLPVGSEQAAQFYADAAVDAGCAFVNCMPVFLASNPDRAKKFFDAKLPIIGDDIKSQVGATIVHRVLAQLFKDRGVHLDRTMQLNVGGNSDFLNMLERSRLQSKKISKTQAVTSVAGVPFAPGDIHVGPSDHVPWLTDRKWAYIRLEGRAFGGAPLNLELKLEVWDSPNSAGIVIDAIRCAKLAKDRDHRGPVIEPSACFMKSPPAQFEDADALSMLEGWIAGDYDFENEDDPEDLVNKPVLVDG